MIKRFPIGSLVKHLLFALSGVFVMQNSFGVPTYPDYSTVATVNLDTSSGRMFSNKGMTYKATNTHHYPLYLGGTILVQVTASSKTAYISYRSSAANGRIVIDEYPSDPRNTTLSPSTLSLSAKTSWEWVKDSLNNSTTWMLIHWEPSSSTYNVEYSNTITINIGTSAINDDTPEEPETVYDLVFPASGGKKIACPASSLGTRYVTGYVQPPSWLTVSMEPDNAGTWSQYLRAEENTAAKIRTASVVFNLSDGSVKTVTVKQEAAVLGPPSTPSLVADSYKLALKSVSTKYGTVSGGGEYAGGEKATIKAKARSGYVFAGWFTDKACKKPLNPKGYDNRRPTVRYTMPEKNTTVYAKFVTKAAAKKSLKFSSATKKLASTAKKATVGRAFSLVLGISSSTLPTVTAKGLPKGLKIDKATGRISGEGKVPGSFTVTVTVRDAAGNKITQKVKIAVSVLPWVKVGFYGTAFPDGKTLSYLRFSVGRTGKVTGKVIQKGKAYSFTSSLASCTADRATFKPQIKIGSRTFKPGTVYVWRLTSTVYGEETDSAYAYSSKETFHAHTKAGLVKRGKAFARLIGKTCTFTRKNAGSGLAKAGDKLVVKFGDNNTATVTGTVNGRKLSPISWFLCEGGSIGGWNENGEEWVVDYDFSLDVIDADIGYERTIYFTIDFDGDDKPTVNTDAMFWTWRYSD